MKMTTGGRVTVPSWIRNQFGFSPGTELECAFDGDAISIWLKGDAATQARRPERQRRDPGRVRMTTDEIMALLGE